jgi:hypothetical protein
VRQDQALCLRFDFHELSEIFLAKISDAILIEAKQLEFTGDLLVPSPNLYFHWVQLEILSVLSDLGNDLLGSIILPHLGPVEYLVKVNVPRVIRFDYQSFQVFILG